jgi:hypothetical protein
MVNRKSHFTSKLRGRKRKGMGVCVWGGSHRPDERPHGVASHDLLHQAAVMRTKQSFSFLFFPILGRLSRACLGKSSYLFLVRELRERMTF